MSFHARSLMSQATRQVDVVILGAGSAGLVARRAAKAAGATVLLCDGGTLGTTCARVGCMPSKLLIAAATHARAIRRAPELGVHSGALQVDGPAVMKRLRAERDRFTGFVVRDIQALSADELLQENVTLTGPSTLVSTSGIRIEAKAVVVATGSTPVVPPPLRALTSRLLTSDSVFELEDIPATIAVVGSGIIGLELGQAFAALGTKVTVLDREDNLSALTDPAIADVYRAALVAEVTLLSNVDIQSAQQSDTIAELTWKDDEGVVHTGQFDYVLVAAGRKPALHGLGLEEAGAVFDERGRLTVMEGRLQVDTLPIFIAGDANGLRPLLHEASDEGRIAGENAARTALFGHEEGRCYERRTSLAIAFTDPQTATGGARYADLLDGDFATGSVSFTGQGRSRVDGVNVGQLHVYGAKPTGKLLGFEMVGPEAEHIAHLLSWSIQQGLTVGQVLDMPFYHPVVEEGLRTALQSLARNLEIRNTSRLRSTECGPIS